MTSSLERPVFNVLLVIASAVLWAGFWYFSQWFFASASYAKGISLIYFPAGIRLAIVLLFGVWGAIGIALSNPLLFLTEFGQQSAWAIILNSLISGFVPLLVARVVQRLLGIDGELVHLRPAHLPLLALAVSVVTPLAFNLQFLFLGEEHIAALWKNMTAMMLGDFLGCLVVLVLVRVAIAALRMLRPRPA